jgi:hypothetical protein
VTAKDFFLYFCCCFSAGNAWVPDSLAAIRKTCLSRLVLFCAHGESTEEPEAPPYPQTLTSRTAPASGIPPESLLSGLPKLQPAEPLLGANRQVRLIGTLIYWISVVKVSVNDRCSGEKKPADHLPLPTKGNIVYFLLFGSGFSY